jgi:DNA-binding SARP family transcriptional activator
MGDKTRLSQVWINLGDLARDAGLLARAQTLYADALAQLAAAGDQSSRALALHSLGLVAAAQEDDQRARALFQESLQLYHATRFPLGMIESLEALACVLTRQGRSETAARWLAAAGAARRALSVPVAPVDQAQHELSLAAAKGALGDAGFAAAWSAGQGLSLEQAVSEALGPSAADLLAPSGVAAPPPQLRAFALGAARVEVEERALADADWTYAKARELFFYLLAHPAARKSQVGLDLWPDASPEQLRSAFHRTLYFLRRALGAAAWVVFEDDTYHLNRALGYWFDVDAFGSHLSAARQALRAGATPATRAQAAAHLESALALYHGDYLEDIVTGDWVVFQREELRRRNLEAHLRLGELHFANAGYDRAADVYRRVIALEPYLETAHRQLMRCLARQGETGQAARHYQGLRQRLLDELRTPPAPETTLLFERLRRGDDV